MAVDHKPPQPQRRTGSHTGNGQLRDTSLIWRLSLWAGAATVALAAAILMTFTDTGYQRLQMAFSASAAPTKMVTQADFTGPPRVADEGLRPETARLEAQVLEAKVRDLTADRERLNSRIASLEQSLSDVTGSIKRELAIVAATEPARATPTLTLPSNVGASKPAAAAPEPTRDTNAEQKAEQSVTSKSKARYETKSDQKSVAKPDSKSHTMAETVPAIRPPVAQIPPTAPAMTPAAPTAIMRQQGQQQAEPPAPLQALAALQDGEADEDAQGMAPPLGPPIRLPPRPVIAAVPVGNQIAVDLGGARSMEILQARWIAVKANFGPYLTGLRPLAVRDRRRGVIPYRLIVGPLPNGAAAAEICKRFAASHVACRSTKFAGEQLIIQ